MIQSTQHVYEFGPFRVDSLKRLLLRDGQPVPLTPKAFDILLVFVEHHGEALSKDELMRAVWPDTAVEENNLTRNISSLRKALGEKPNQHQYIVTIPGRGYRFVADGKESGIGRDDSVSPELIESGAGAVEETGERNKSFARKLLSHVARRKAIAGAFLVVVTGLVLLYALSRSNSRSAVPFQKTEITAITRTGNANGLAISPDGHYIAYGLTEAGRQSLWLRNVATASVQQIVPPAEVHYYGLTFSRNGDHLYFVRSEKDSPFRLLYRMPALGGAPTRLLTDLDWAPGFSPDGARIAFVRSSRSLGKSALMIANADGSGAYQLAVRALSEMFIGFTAWAPDGKAIVVVAGNREVSGANQYLVEVRVADGAERTITAQRWRGLGFPTWLPDGSGLLMVGHDKSGGAEGIWHLSWPSGEARRITSDPEIYGGLSLTADSGTLVTAKIRLQTNIWTVPAGDGTSSAAGLARQITTGFSDYNWAAWMPDGRILFTASEGSVKWWDLWVINADGTGRKQLTANAGNHWEYAVSPDGRYVVFTSDRAGRMNIWRMNSDGSNPKQLTNGSGEKFPACSSDSKWVIYTSVDNWTLWKVPIDGGEPVRVTHTYARGAAISPDGNWIAYLSREPQPGSPYRIVVIPFAGGPPIRTFDFPQGASHGVQLRWTPDGQAVAYTVERDGVSNIWRQPIAGGQPVQLTDFKSDEIFDFGWSRDGSQLVCTRGLWATDVFMIKSIE